MKLSETPLPMKLSKMALLMKLSETDIANET